MLDELRYYYGALVLISHDRSVLDELVTTIWEVHEGKVRYLFRKLQRLHGTKEVRT